MNVVDVIVKEDYCIGCGVCAGICPSNNLHMDWSNKGELIPNSNDKCKVKCSLCLDICPFNNHTTNQDDIVKLLFEKVPKINYNEYAGYYLNCYVGFHVDEEKRIKSASGGLASLFLSSLLEENVVDKIIAVGNVGDINRIFDFKILSNSDEVYSCAGSAYYPVEISRVLTKIIKEKEELTYAIIALPCVVYALRLAIEKIPKIKKKIKIIGSLTCGQLQNRYCTELLALESGLTVNSLSKMDFRRKSVKNSASNFLQVAMDKDGTEGIPQPYQELPFFLWHYQFFKQNACNYCDDVFGELADVTFMDAWLPEYVKDYKGTSLIIARTLLTKSLLESSDELDLNEIKIEKVLESQQGIIKKKRILLKGRLYKKELNNSWYPKKRVNSDKNIYNKNKEFIELTDEIKELSKYLWPKYRLCSSTNEFWKDFNELKSKIKRYENKTRLKNLSKLPVIYLKKVFRGLRW
ncbi:Coenzyme F420 hydrogenase/dehydrogenase, beta subunit C-terminal domain [Methanobacterium formicicum]|uniref:Coenzyme F420 hydrogenase/dehydrogenase, beta subunit C-terminal domain n=1 Tax=Methanobacterium formicicum TaxID=2162 RepID=A0A843AP53_METFO|nr:Coenzyme F420 hydrogenase/dehydrogenase, beta subunit C-terminal domain [Methanobacterium formicicum]MBF4475251.1 Coenzyme F420 hydrogenase/dehydrogenase, beta subunit C-terminal domain [Methanobacterium formicicum]